VLQDAAAFEVHLDLPAAREPHLGHAAAGAQVDAPDVVPAGDREARLRGEASQQVVQRDLRRRAAPALLGRWTQLQCFLVCKSRPLTMSTSAGKAMQMLAQ
jgi:hypothetical protein